MGLAPGNVGISALCNPDHPPPIVITVSPSHQPGTLPHKSCMRHAGIPGTRRSTNSGSAPSEGRAADNASRVSSSAADEGRRKQQRVASPEGGAGGNCRPELSRAQPSRSRIQPNSAESEPISGECSRLVSIPLRTPFGLEALGWARGASAHRGFALLQEGA